jgi:hypothetical protein
MLGLEIGAAFGFKSENDKGEVKGAELGDLIRLELGLDLGDLGDDDDISVGDSERGEW